MKSISQHEVISLILDINSFADDSENRINIMQTNYDKDKRLMNARHSNDLSSLEKNYNKNCNEIRNNVKSTISNAKRILADIESLDEKLSKVDKYYVKTKKKKQELLAEKTSEKYTNTTDYFSAFEEIQTSFKALFKKYSEDILPGLINGLNYLFSSQRKKDYEELIILKNTVIAFVDEIQEILPTLSDDELSELKQTYFTSKGALTEKQKQERNAFENNHLSVLDKTANDICSNLDAILPDELVDYFYSIINDYSKNIHQVNTSNKINNEVLNMMFVDYPVDYFVQSKIVASVIKDKCKKLLVNENIRLPIISSITNSPVWLIKGDNSNPSDVHSFMQSIMYGYLSSCPVSQIKFSIVDPENRGNSIYPYFDAKKKLPELFGEKIYISKEDITEKITSLNEKIENILQNKLGNQYDSIYDFSKVCEEEVCTEVFLLFDFPKNCDERVLSELRNILRNGSKCGIFTYIYFQQFDDESYSKEYIKNLQTIFDLCVQISQDNSNFIYNGLGLSYFTMPEKVEFSQFFSKYMLIFEGIKNKGIAFSPIIKKLVDAKDNIELDEAIKVINNINREYETTYAKVPQINSTFPSNVILGNVKYPIDIFIDSFGFERIIEIFGEKDANGDYTSQIELPLTFNLKSTFNLFLNCPESASKQIQHFTHHVMWSFLSFMPATKVNISVFDCEQRGNSIIPFLDFRKKDPDVFDGKIYTSQEAIYDKLKQLNNQIDEFIQEKLGNRFEDILDYNINTPNRSEPITLLFLYDFPSGVDSRSLDLLSNVLRNGNKCGVFTIICHNPNIVYSKYESIDEKLEQLLKYCSVIDYKDGNYNLMPFNLKLKIPEPLSYENTNTFAKEYTDICDAIKKQGLSFKDIISNELFSYDSSKSLKIPIGVGDGDSIVNITIGEGSSHHGLIAGATGSGKSTLLHTLIMSAMLHYTPEQLNLYLMDFKSGTEFKIYESVRLPHIKLLALDAMQEFGESILENLVCEMERRGKLFKEVEQTSLKGYKQASGKELPRILVIMDEFQILFNDSTNRKVAMNCAELAKRIVTEGRAFGIHLLMATQSTKVISDLTLSRGTIEQMRIRIGLKCGEDDARYMFSDENDSKALALMKGPIGTAVMNLDYTELSNVGFRAAYCDESTQKEFLDLICQRFQKEEYTLQTFEGGRTTALLDYFNENSIVSTDELPVRIHMGSLIKVAPPFEISIDRKKKHNMLICGANEYMANMIANNYMISAILNKHATVYCIDGDTLVGDNSSQEFYEVLCNYSSSFHYANSRVDIISFINEIYKEYQRRKKENSDDIIFVFIKNLQFLDLVKSILKGDYIDESEYLENQVEETEINPLDPFAAVNSMFTNNKNASDNTTVNEKLKKMIDDGTGFGINFVVSSLEFQTVKECMYFGDNLLPKFPERVIFSLGTIDADMLVENVSISALRDNTVYYSDGVKNTFQLKPYIVPSAYELEQFLQA